MRLLWTWVAFAGLLISCKPTGLEMESDPNGLYTPHLTSNRNNGEVTLKWVRPGCAFCGGCPCATQDPDYFEVLFSDRDPSDLRIHSVLDSDVFETTITGLDNGKPYYFGIRAVVSNEKYTQSKTIMTIPDQSENTGKLFQPIDQDARFGSWSPDGSLVAYVSDYIWNNGNNGAQSVFISALSNDSSYLIELRSRSPEWSPAGNKIVYHTENGEASTSEGHTASHIAVYDVSDSTTRRITGGSSFDYLPSWSPDGNWVAFLSDRSKGKEFNIWKVPATGGAAVQVTSDFNDLNDIGGIDGRSPKTLSWSKDGKNIAFARLTKHEQGNTDIYSVSADGQGARTTLVASPWNDYCPAYSPDGKTIAFVSDRSGAAEIWTMDLQSKKLRQITGSTGIWVYENSGKIEWSASGDKILFTGSAGNFFALYTVGAG